jgi:quercetin dioxygenase-like cupin family protein
MVWNTIIGGYMFGKKSGNGYKEILEGIQIKTINYGPSTLMVEFLLKKGSLLIEHSHNNEQTGYLVKGRLKLYINGAARIVNPGDSWNISSDIKHKAEIEEDSIAVVVFSPCREDYLKYINREDIIE